MTEEIVVTDAQGHEWTCHYVVTAGGGVASGAKGKGTEGQEHFWRCTRGEHARTIAVSLEVDFRTLSNEERLSIIEDAFNISGEWERQ